MDKVQEEARSLLSDIDAMPYVRLQLVCMYAYLLVCMFFVYVTTCLIGVSYTIHRLRACFRLFIISVELH